MSQWFKMYINMSYYDKNVLILAEWCTQQCQLAVHNMTESAVLWIVQ
jgi:hypothetical protein